MNVHLQKLDYYHSTYAEALAVITYTSQDLCNGQSSTIYCIVLQEGVHYPTLMHLWRNSRASQCSIYLFSTTVFSH